jgi:predicted permease
MLPIFAVSFFSVLKIVLVCLAGTILARRGIIDKQFRATISRVILYLMLPCLLISKLSSSVSIESLGRLAVLPVSAIVYVIVGMILGTLVVFVSKPSWDLRRIVVASTTFGNSGYIPYPLIAAIAASAPMFAEDPHAADRGMAYVSIYLVCFSPCLWGIGYPYLAHRPLRDLKWHQLLSPPIMSAIAGIVIGTVPALNRLFVGPEAPAGILLETCELIGDGVIPCALLVLGANLADPPRSREKVPARALMAVWWGRLLLMPLFGCLYTLFLYRQGWLPNDPICALVLMVESAVPPATNLVVMCQLHEKGEAAMSRVLVSTYLVAVPTLTITVAMQLWILSRL